MRDRIIGVAPKDVDVVTSARPEEVLALFPRALPVGVSFGVVLIPSFKKEKPGEGGKVEVATFRSDGRYLDGRHPEKVVFSDEKEDALRRDFTINGLFYDPVEDRLIDYVGGEDDIRRKIIRTIGNPDDRFGEDYLRMLRAIRFSAQLSFSIEPSTLACVTKNAALIRKVSGERIREELEKILTGPDPVRGIGLLVETGILAALFPETLSLKTFWWEHVFRMFAASGERSLEISLAILFHGPSEHEDGREKERQELLTGMAGRLRLSNLHTEKIGAILAARPRFPGASRLPAGKLKRFLRQPWFEEIIEFYRLESVSEGASLTDYLFCREKMNLWGPEELFPRPALTGDSLIELGYPAGPRFKKILYDLEEEQLEGRVRTKEEGLRWLAERYPL